MKSFREYINLIENAQHPELGEGTSHHVRMVMNLAADLMKQHGFRAVGQLGVSDLKQIAQKTDATLHDVCIILNIDHVDPQTTEDVTEGFTDTLKFAWRELKTNVVDFVANAVGLPNDQRREVFVRAGNEFSNEVIKLLADHPARDKLIPMVREIGGYMAKARTLEELKSLLDKAGLFLADVEAGKFNPPGGVAKTLPSHRDKQGVAEAEQPVQVTDSWFKQGSFQTYKKADPIKYAVPGQPGTVQTLEGPVKHSAQARIITGPKGEQYPVEPEKFAQLYDDNGNGTATPKKIPKLAKLADHDGVLHTSWGDLQYTAGNDYIVRHGTNDYGAVKKDIFAQTYALPQGVAEEELDEAGTPDAVRRIEQLVQYK